MSLRANIIEISQATAASDLIANRSGTCCYRVGTWFGRLWIWYHKIEKYVTHEDRRQGRLLNAIKITRRLFVEKMEQQRARLPAYRTKLEKPLDESAFLSLDEWVGDYDAFAKEIEKNRRIQEIFAWAATEPIPPCKERKELRYVHRTVHFQKRTGLPIPFSLLKSLAADQMLTKRCEISLSRWITTINRQINDPKSGITCHEVRRLIKDLSSQPHLLEIKLYEKGFSTLLSPDPHFLQWRDSLQSGTELQWNQKTARIEEELKGDLPKPDRKNKHRVFSIKNDPKHVVVVGTCPCQLNIEDREKEPFQKVLQLPKLAYRDSRGRFAIYERLYESIRDLPRKYSEVKEDAKRRDMIRPLVNLIKALNEEQLFPPDLNPLHIHYNSQGQLRTTTFLSRSVKGYQPLIYFMQQCAQDNHELFMALVGYTGIDLNPKYFFFHKILKTVLGVEVHDVKTWARRCNIDEQAMIDEGEKLLQTLTKMRERLFRRAQEAKQDSPNTKEFIHTQFSRYYQERCVANVLWPTMEKDLMEQLEKYLRECSSSQR